MAQSQTFANLDPVLKDNYGVGLKNAINNVNALATLVKVNDRDLIGRRAVWALHSGRSGSSGNRAEGAALPAALPQNYVSPEEALVYAYHTIKVTGQAQVLTRGDEGAFVRGLESELRGAEEDIKNDYARQQFGQSLTNGTVLKTGVLGIVETTDPGGTSTFGVAEATESEMLYFFVGEPVQFINPSGGAARAGTAADLTITAVDIDAKTVTVAGMIDAAVNDEDYIVRYGNFGTEINGLRHLISKDVFAGIDPSTVPSWGAITTGSSTTAISEVALDNAKTLVRTRGNGGTPDIWVSDPYQERKLITQLITQRRYDAAKTTVTSGWDGVKISQGTLISDKFCPTTSVFGLTMADIERFVGLEWSWDDSGGSVLYKALDDTDAVQARFRCYHQWVSTNRNSHVAVSLQVPTF